MKYNLKAFPRSEYKALEFKFSMAQENIDRLEKELKLMKDTQKGFDSTFLNAYIYACNALLLARYALAPFKLKKCL